MANIEGYKLELRKALQNIMLEETKAWLIKTLLKQKLATWDVYYFARKQADLRINIKALDWSTMSSALRVKLRDMKLTIKTWRRRKSWAEDNIKKYYGVNINPLKQIIAPWKKMIKQEKQCRLDKIKEKIEQYRNKQNGATDNKVEKEHIIPTRVPKYLSEYANLTIFKSADDFPKPGNPIGPFIGSEKIVLTEGEKKILSRDPKYSLRYGAKESEFKVELEKMNIKKKFGTANDQKAKTIRNDKCTGRLKNDILAHEENLITEYVSGGKVSDHEERIESDKVLDDLWEETRHRLVFDPIKNRINFNMRRPTEYKHNRRLNLPKPSTTDIEFECENRRRKYIGCFRKFQSSLGAVKKKRKKLNNSNDVKTNETIASDVDKEKKEQRVEKDKRRNRSSVNNVENLSKYEQQGLRSLKKRISSGEIFITTTDKSGRMAVLTKEQYLDSGGMHTKKDQELGWNEIKYLQNQLNNHTWWTSEILGNGKNTDPTRMARNIQEFGCQIPEMYILIKDHKTWDENSKTPIPSRPVLSGNCCLNTHLSELVAELVEPISTSINSAEISSTEEALQKINALNKLIRSNEDWVNNPKFNILRNIGRKMNQTLHEMDPKLSSTVENENMPDTNVFSSSTVSGITADPDTTLNSSDDSIVSVLEHLFETGHMASTLSTPVAELNKDDGKATNGMVAMDDIVVDSKIIPTENKEAVKVTNGETTETECSKEIYQRQQTKITDFWSIKDSVNIDDNVRLNLSKKTRISHMESMIEILKNKAKRSKAFMEVIENETHSSIIWGKKLDLIQVSNEPDPNSAENSKRNSSLGLDSEIPTIQNFDQKPIFIGADVVSLYPNLEKSITGEMMYRAVMESNITFEGIDYERLSVYLFLTLGAGVLTKCGLEVCIPTRRGDPSESRSLAGKRNRDLSEWMVKSYNFTDKIKKEMLGRLIQTLTVVLMSSSCYTFGGKIYRQKTGAGIGERSSACIAKVTMSLWDKMWASSQMDAGLWIPLFIRYIDDIRVYVFPINPGWDWSGTEWVYKKDEDDGLSYEQRTRRTLLKTSNSILEGIDLTVERELDFEEGMLPTLDFKTRVRPDGEIEYKYFRKPMASGLLIQKGTALSKQTVFSSLRQELIRRLTNISDHFQISTHIEVIEEFTKCLANSGHRFSFGKSIILQALTRYKFIKERDRMEEANKLYRPMFRGREYDFELRCKQKHTEKWTWYTGKRFGDAYRHNWKRRISLKGMSPTMKSASRKKFNRTEVGAPTTVMFVPSSTNGELLNRLESLEQKMLESDDMKWSVKLVEKSGIPLAITFRKKIPIEKGCPLGMSCQVCENDAVLCSIKGVVYEASCVQCKDLHQDTSRELYQDTPRELYQDSPGELVDIKEQHGDPDNNIPKYIGETSRLFRMRTKEH